MMSIHPLLLGRRQCVIIDDPEPQIKIHRLNIKRQPSPAELTVYMSAQPTHRSQRMTGGVIGSH